MNWNTLWEALSWLSPIIAWFLIGGFFAARDVKNNHVLFTFIRKAACQFKEVIDNGFKGREDLVESDENLKRFIKDNDQILVACEKVFELDKPHLHKRWINPVTEFRYLLARRRVLKEAM